MKKIPIILILIINFATAQVDSIMHQLQYYPLHTGDYWEYNIKTTGFGVEPKESKYTIQVIGDSLLPNGKFYKILKKENIFPDLSKSYYYQRIDTTLGHVYQYISQTTEEILKLYLYAEPWGSLEYPNFDLYSIEHKSVLGIPTIFQTFFQASGISSFWYKRFGQGFGYCGSTHSTSSSSSNEILVYSIINGIEYMGENPNSIANINSNPEQFSLSQNYPNPFNQSTIISYYLSVESFVLLTIYDLSGRRIETLVSKNQNPGTYLIKFDSRDLSSGEYIYHLESNGFTQTRKMLIIN